MSKYCALALFVATFFILMSMMILIPGSSLAQAPQFTRITRVGKFVDLDDDNLIEEGEVSWAEYSIEEGDVDFPADSGSPNNPLPCAKINWEENSIRNGDILLLEVKADDTGYATPPAEITANFYYVDSEYIEGDEQPAIPGDGSSKGGALNLTDYLDNNEDGTINDKDEAYFYLICYEISSSNTREDGEYPLEITISDGVGNTTTTRYYSERDYSKDYPGWIPLDEVDVQQHSPVVQLDNTPPLIDSVLITLINQPDEPQTLDSVTAVNKQITALEVNFSDGEGSGVNIASSDVVLLNPENTVIEADETDKTGNQIKLSWPVTDPPLDLEGYYTVRVGAQDLAGNTADYVTDGFIYDLKPPFLASVRPADLATVTQPLTSVTAVISEDTNLTDEVAGVDIANCQITLKDEEGTVIAQGGDPIDGVTLRLEPEGEEEYLTLTTGTYFITVRCQDYAGNKKLQTTKFSLEIAPVAGVSEVSLNWKGEMVYDLASSTEPLSPSVFASSPVDTAYLKVNLNEGISLDEDATNVSLLKVEKVYTGGGIEAEPVKGTSYLSYNSIEGWVELYFFISSPFGLEEEPTQDGFYQVKGEIVDMEGNRSELGFFFVYDTTPPDVPEFEREGFDKTTGVLTLSGTTKPESSEPQRIQGFVNGSLKATTQARPDRSFSIQLQLDKGENSITLRAMDRAGNKGEPTTPMKITYSPQRLVVISFRYSKFVREASPVKLTYYLSEPAKVTIRIYNLLGEIVYEWQQEVAPGSEEEWSWNGKNMFGRQVNNGVYIMSIKAVSSTKEEKITKAVGVLR